jgi:tRNA A-37 threonylcarbamoyl transferase component Bud32
VSTLDDGRSVGRYRIIRFLGAGAMGEVYLAEDPHIERKLAIKTVRLAGGRPQDIEDRKRRLLREARAAGRLLHPNVVTLFDTGEQDGVLYLAFEFVEGRDLASRIEEGPPPSLGEVLRVIGQVADALDYAHRQGIVHRDIKPSNILLDTTGKVKVADFGIAKVAGQNTELTVVGSVMGSPQYLSPEQIRGEELDGRSDVFSLGVVLYELLSGRRPFDGETITTLVYQILHKDPSISELRTVPLRLDQLLHRMLAKDREGRVATAEMVAEELAAIGRELPAAVLAAPAAAVTQELDATRVMPPRTTLPPGAAGTESASAAGEAGAAAARSAPSAGAPGIAGVPGSGSAMGAPGIAGAPSAAESSGPAGTAPLGAQGASPPAGLPGPPPLPLSSAHPGPPASQPHPAAGAVPGPPRRRGAGIWIGVAAILLLLVTGFAVAALWTWQHYIQPAIDAREAANHRTATPADTAAAPTALPPSPAGASTTGAAATAASSAGTARRSPSSPSGSPPAGPAAVESSTTGSQTAASSLSGSPPAGSSRVGSSATGSAGASTTSPTVSRPPAANVSRPPAAAGAPSPAATPSRAGAAPRTPATAAAPARGGSAATAGATVPATEGGGNPVHSPDTASPPVPLPAPRRNPAARSVEEPPARKGAASGPASAAPSAPSDAGGEREAAPAVPAADQVLRSGLQLAFRVSPGDAFVLLDGTVIGHADDWSGDKKARSYTLPGPGSYLLKIKRDGMKDYRVAVEASATRGVTQVTARLQPLPAAQVETSDLRTYRVRDAIALHVQPENALVLVDGQTRGMARQFAGRFGRPGEWLTLEPGKHRVTVTAPGFRREDIAVEVYAGADKDHEKVDIVLRPGPGGE